MGYVWTWGFLWRYEALFVRGVGVTLAFTFGTILLGLIFGLVVGMLRLSKSWWVNAPLVALIEVFPDLVEGLAHDRVSFQSAANSSSEPMRAVKVRSG